MAALEGSCEAVGSAALGTEGPQGSSAVTDSHPVSAPHRDGRSDSSVSRARGHTVHAGGHDKQHSGLLLVFSPHMGTDL